MKSGNIHVRALIEKLGDVLNRLDTNDMAIPAIKVEEAINALKKQEFDNSASTESEK